jgi:hypothetical protein
VLRIWDPVLFYPLDPDLFDFAPETIRSKKKVSFYFSSLFLCRIRDEKGSDPDQRYSIPDPQHWTSHYNKTVFRLLSTGIIYSKVLPPQFTVEDSKWWSGGWHSYFPCQLLLPVPFYILKKGAACHCKAA